MSIADQIWDRACRVKSTDDLRPGDVALNAMIAFHSRAMNGGVLHAIGSRPEGEIRISSVSYRYFELDDVADLIGRALSAIPTMTDAELEDYESELDAEYGVIVPNDSILVEKFEAYYSENPEEFLPVE